MEYDETLYEVLLHTSIDDLIVLCKTNKQINHMCHTPYFLQQKFNMLPFTIYKPIKQTLNNLFYINYLTHAAYKLTKFLMIYDVIFYNSPNKNIKDLSYVSPFVAGKILKQVNQLTKPDESSRFYGVFEGSILLLTYNNKFIEEETIVTNDQKFYLSYWIYTPGDFRQAIDLTTNQVIEYILNVFLHDKKYILVGVDVNEKIETVKELEHFINTRFIKLSPKRRLVPHYKLNM